jgi:lysylphosphatidylglycerol synthetase-like protein (DUF2156 family)
VLSLLLFLHLTKRDDHHHHRPGDDAETGALVAALCLLPAIVILAMPVLVWAAVRENGYSRQVAAWWVSLSVASCGLVAALAGSWWWLLVAAFVASDLAILHISLRIWRDQRIEARSYQNDPEWVSTRR